MSIIIVRSVYSTNFRLHLTDAFGRMEINIIRAEKGGKARSI